MSPRLQDHYHFWRLTYLPKEVFHDVIEQIMDVELAQRNIMDLGGITYADARKLSKTENAIRDCIIDVFSREDKRSCCKYFCIDYVKHFPLLWMKDGAVCLGPREWRCFTIGGLHTYCLKYKVLTGAQRIEAGRRAIEEKFIRKFFGNPFSYGLRQLQNIKHPLQRTNRHRDLRLNLVVLDSENTPLMRYVEELMLSMEFSLKRGMERLTHNNGWKYLMVILLTQPVSYYRGENATMWPLSEVLNQTQIETLANHPFEADFFGLLAVERCDIERNQEENRTIAEYFAHVFRWDNRSRSFQDSFELFSLSEAVMKYAYLARHPEHQCMTKV